MAVVGGVLDHHAGEVFAGLLGVVHVGAHHAGELLGVRGTRPLETGDVTRHAHRPHRRGRLARLGEQMLHHERRVAHHVVEHAAALQVALPEPRHVRPAVLLGGAGEVGAPGDLGAARPEQGAARGDVRCEQLVLEIARRDAGLLHHLDDFLGLGDVAPQRLLARDAEQLGAALHRGDDLLEVRDAREVRPADPDGVDGGVLHQRGDRGEGLGITDAELA